MTTVLSKKELVNINQTKSVPLSQGETTIQFLRSSEIIIPPLGRSASFNG